MTGIRRSHLFITLINQVLGSTRAKDLLKSLTQELVFAEALFPTRFKGIVVIHKTSMVTIAEVGKPEKVLFVVEE